MSVSVARKSGGHHIDANQELIALGGTNLLTSLFHGFPVTGVVPVSPVRSPLTSVVIATPLRSFVDALNEL